jgi:anti-sigma factor RsiW
MRCTDVYLFICDNLDQDIDSPRCREIRKHLEGCPDCSAYLASLKQTVVLYRAVPAPHMPRRVHARLVKAINSLNTAGGGTPKRRRRATR